MHTNTCSYAHKIACTYKQLHMPSLKFRTQTMAHTPTHTNSHTFIKTTTETHSQIHPLAQIHTRMPTWKTVYKCMHSYLKKFINTNDNGQNLP